MTDQTKAGLARVVWIRECSDGGIEGPIMDCDRRIDDTRRKFWTGFVRQADAAAIIAGKDAEIERLSTENKHLRLIGESALKVCNELDEVTLALPMDYLDMPDGGNVSLGTQVTRMKAHRDELQATITQQAERIAELEREVEEYDAALLASDADLMKAQDQATAIATAVMTDQVSNDSRALFIAAIRDLAAINEALGCDPDDGGAVPIIEAVDELKARIAAQSAALSKARDALEYERDAIKALMSWCAKNVDKWDFPQYDNVSYAVMKCDEAIAALGQPEGEKGGAE